MTRRKHKIQSFIKEFVEGSLLFGATNVGFPAHADAWEQVIAIGIVSSSVKQLAVVPRYPDTEKTSITGHPKSGYHEYGYWSIIDRIFVKRLDIRSFMLQYPGFDASKYRL